jgi:ABC-type Fe3+ transport system permease subunit
MKFDSRYSAPIRPIFRIPAIIIGAIQLIVGIFCLFESDFKIGIPQTLVGLMFLTVGIKGRLPKWLDSEERGKEYETKRSEGKSVTRKICLLSLCAIVFVVAILVYGFFSSELFSVGWWFAIAFTLFSIVGFYLNFTILITSKGFHPLLAFTIIFPIALLLLGVVNPRKFEQI